MFIFGCCDFLYTFSVILYFLINAKCFFIVQSVLVYISSILLVYFDIGVLPLLSILSPRSSLPCCFLGFDILIN